MPSTYDLDFRIYSCQCTLYDLERIHSIDLNRKNFEYEGEDHIPSDKASYFMTKKYFEVEPIINI